MTDLASETMRFVGFVGARTADRLIAREALLVHPTGNVRPVFGASRTPPQHHRHVVSCARAGSVLPGLYAQKAANEENIIDHASHRAMVDGDALTERLRQAHGKIEIAFSIKRFVTPPKVNPRSYLRQQASLQAERLNGPLSFASLRKELLSRLPQGLAQMRLCSDTPSAMSAAILVGRKDAKQIAQQLDDHLQTHCVAGDFTILGPLPPYTFFGIDLSAQSEPAHAH